MFALKAKLRNEGKKNREEEEERKDKHKQGGHGRKFIQQ